MPSLFSHDKQHRDCSGQCRAIRLHLISVCQKSQHNTCFLQINRHKRLSALCCDGQCTMHRYLITALPEEPARQIAMGYQLHYVPLAMGYLVRHLCGDRVYIIRNKPCALYIAGGARALPAHKKKYTYIHIIYVVGNG